MILPPALYWSASLAEHLNAIDGDDPMHGIIDTTGIGQGFVAEHWSADERAFMPLAELPADARRLVVEAPVSTVAERRFMLARALQSTRASNGWSVNDAASKASIAPMTWRRLEEGLDVRQGTLVALDELLNQPRGTVVRALAADQVMSDLINRLGVLL